MRKFMTLGALALYALTGCAAEKPLELRPMVSEIGDDLRYVIDAQNGKDQYQASLEQIRHGLTDDRELYEFAAALGLIRQGMRPAEFLKRVHGLTAQEVIAIGRRDAFALRVAELQKRMTAKELRDILKERVTLIPENVMIVDVSDKDTRDRTLAALIIDSGDIGVYEMTTALDVVLALSDSDESYNRMLGGKTAFEIIEFGRTNMFDAAVRKYMLLTPASVLRGKIDFPADTAGTPRLSMATPTNQVITMGAVVQSLNDDQLYMLMTAIEILSSTLEDEEVKTRLDGKSAGELVRKVYTSNPGGFIETMSVMRSNYTIAQLDQVRAQLLARAAVAKAELNNPEGADKAE